MNLNQNITFGNQSAVSSSQQHNVMQPTSPQHGYTPGSSPYAYGVPVTVRSSGVTTNHWRPAGYSSQANWNQNQPNIATSHPSIPGNPLLRHSALPHIPVTSNTVHYHGDQLPATSNPYNTNIHGGQNQKIIQNWSSSPRQAVPASLVQNINAINSTVYSSALPSIKQEQRTEDDDYTDPNLLRQKVLEYYMGAMESLRVEYRDMLQELFFMQNGGNLVDYHGWRKRPNPQLLAFLNASRLDNEMTVSTPTATNTVSPSVQVQAAYSGKGQPGHMYGNSRHVQGDHIDNRHNFNQHVKSAPLVTSSVYSSNYGFTSQLTITSSQSSANTPLPLAVSNVNGMPQQTKQDTPLKPPGYKEALISKGLTPSGSSGSPFGTSSLSSMYGNTLGTQEDIALQARKEQEILQRIAELRKEGLWSASRLPKVHEPPRKKAHWDYLIEEMQWLATDFSQERRWKRNMARKVSSGALFSR